MFNKLLTRFHRGDCLITLATGKLEKAVADRAGLVDCHAYALLDLRMLQVASYHASVYGSYVYIAGR